MTKRRNDETARPHLSFWDFCSVTGTDPLPGKQSCVTSLAMSEQPSPDYVESVIERFMTPNTQIIAEATQWLKDYLSMPYSIPVMYTLFCSSSKTNVTIEELSPNDTNHPLGAPHCRCFGPYMDH